MACRVHNFHWTREAVLVVWRIRYVQVSEERGRLVMKKESINSAMFDVILWAMQRRILVAGGSSWTHVSVVCQHTQCCVHRMWLGGRGLCGHASRCSVLLRRPEGSRFEPRCEQEMFSSPYAATLILESKPASCTMDNGSISGGVNRPGRGVDHPPPSRAESKERV